MENVKPVTWVLLGARMGDNAQATALARLVGGTVIEKQLTFNATARLPNILWRGGFSSLTAAAQAQVAKPWPDLVIATGRRTARVSLGIKRASGGQTRIVQIGRPRLLLSCFDLVVTTPQYGLPPAANLVELALPLAPPRTHNAADIEEFKTLWRKLPRPWIAAAIGAAKYPITFAAAEHAGFARGLDALALKTGGSVIVMESPRTPPGGLDTIVQCLSAQHWAWRRGRGANPYGAALALADRFAVTSDSVSMVADMLQTGKPTQVFHLPVKRLAPRWSAASGPAGWLARNGLLSPPRDVARLMGMLDKRGWIGDLATGCEPAQGTTVRAALDAAQGELVRRIRAMVSGPSR